MPLGGYAQEPTAENLALSARQVGQPGLGMAAPQQQAPLINPRENPLGAAGLVLGDVAAGLRGQPLRSDKLVQQKMQERQMSMEQQQLQMRSAELGLQIAEKYATVLDHTKPEEHDAVFKDMARYDGATGGMQLRPLTEMIAQYKGAQRQQVLEAADALGVGKDPRITRFVADNPGILVDFIKHEVTKDPTKTLQQISDEEAAKDPAAARARALGLEPGTPKFKKFVEDFGKSPGTTINVPTSPPAQDYRRVYDKDGRVLYDEVIPGTKTAKAEAAASTQLAEGERQRKIQTNVVSQDIGRALNMIRTSTIPVTGLFGAVGQQIPGTPQADLSGLLDGIKANVGFEKLQEMRKNSPTGAALGPVSDKENQLLQSVMGSLEQSKSGAMLQFNLQRLDDTINLIVNGTVNPTTSDGGVSKPTTGGKLTPAEQQEYDALKKRFGG